MQAILVTGAAGFIGSHLTDRLLKRGYGVVGVDNLSKGNRENLAIAQKKGKFQFIVGDIQRVSMDKDLPTKVDCVVHLAASKIPRYGGRLETVLENVEGTKAALELAKKQQCYFILASTSDVYGKNLELPFSETSNSVLGSSTTARWSYAVSKLTAEHLTFAYAEEYGIPVVVIRYFGVYGPREHLGWWGGAQSAFIEQLLDGKPLEIHGDGEQTRCLTYIDDIIDGTVAVLESDKLYNEIVNLGSTEEISMKKLAGLICSLMDRDPQIYLKFVPYESLPSREYQDVKQRIPDLAKAKHYLGYSPKVGLREGLKKTIQWHEVLRGM